MTEEHDDDHGLDDFFSFEPKVGEKVNRWSLNNRHSRFDNLHDDADHDDDNDLDLPNDQDKAQEEDGGLVDQMLACQIPDQDQDQDQDPDPDRDDSLKDSLLEREEWHGDQEQPEGGVAYRVYWRRFLVLAAFSLFSAAQNLEFFSFVGMAAATKRFYGVSSDAITLLLVLCNIVGGLSLAPTAWLLDRSGLRPTLLVASLLLVLCALLRLLGALWLDGTAGWVVAVVGTCFAALASTASLAGPSKLSSVWFAPHERPWSTALGVTSGSLGGALSFLVALDVSDVETVSSDVTAREVRAQLIGQLVLAWLVLAAVWAGVPRAPPTPCSRGADRDTAPLEIMPEMRRMASSVAFCCVTAAGGASQGIFWAWLSLLGLNLEPLGFSQHSSSWLGFSITMAGIVGAWVVGWCAGTLARRHTAVVGALFLSATVLFLLFSAVTSEIVSFQGAYWLAAVSATLGGLLVCAAEPLFYELGVEVAYPAGEGLVSAVVSMVFGFFQLFATILGDFISPSALNWFLVIATLVSGVAMLITPLTYHRRIIDETPNSPHSGPRRKKG